MNKADKKKTSEILSKLQGFQKQVEDLGQELQQLADAEREKYDNLSQGLQEGERGQAIDDAANNLSDAADYCQQGDVANAVEALGNIEL